MAEGYVGIEIRIGAWDDALGAYPVEAELGDGGFFSGGRLTLDRAALRAAWLEPDAYGRLLTDALLAGPIRQAYDLAAAQADAHAGCALRVRLRIDSAAAELHAVLWERLRHQFRGRDVPLSTSTRTPFSRYVGLKAADVKPLAERPVRLLVAVANPADLPPSLAAIDAGQEVEEFTTAVGDLRHNQELMVTVLPGRGGLPPETRERLVSQGYRVVDGATTLDTLRRLLLEHHALHLISHGSFQRTAGNGSGIASLHLEADDGTWEVIKDERFVPALAAAGVLPHLIFLVACESAMRDEETPHPFVGLGPKLVEAGVPAVVAMQDKVTVRAGRQLAGDFWRQLLAHGEVDQALNAARLLLVDDEGTDWSTPVLFMRLADGRVFVPRSATGGAATASAAEHHAATPDDTRRGAAAALLPEPLGAASLEAEQRDGNRLRSLWTGLPGIAKSLIGLVTVLIPLVTALVQSGILPIGRIQTPTPLPPVLAATLSDVHLGAANVPLGDVYEDRPNLDPERDGITPAQLEQLGQLVSYRIDFQGYQGREASVKWTLFDAANGERVPDGAWITNHAQGWPDGFWTIEADQDIVQGEVWVPHVAPGEYVVELEVYDDRDIRLDFARATDAGGQPASFVVRE